MEVFASFEDRDESGLVDKIVIKVDSQMWKYALLGFGLCGGSLCWKGEDSSEEREEACRCHEGCIHFVSVFVGLLVKNEMNKRRNWRKEKSNVE